MSSDQAPGAPSFGDLFDDPDAPLLPVERAGAGAATAAARRPGPVETPATPAEDAEPDPEPATADARPVDADTSVAEHPADEPRDDEDAGAEASDVAFASPYTEGPTPDDLAPDEPLAEQAEADAPLITAAATAAAWDGTVDPAISSAPATRVDTGRLYRSAGAEGPSTLDAIPAIDPTYVPRKPSAVSAAAASSVVPELQGGGRGLTYSGVAVVVISVTVLVAFADALINDKLGIITGIALAVSSIYAAVTVRRGDIWAAVVMPPLAFLIAALTAGQLTLDSSGSLLIREAYMLFRTLAVNAPWILGTTVVCLVIVLVRRARS